MACPHCTRDLYLFKPLMQQIAGLELRVATLEAGVAVENTKAIPGSATPISQAHAANETPEALGARDLVLLIGLPLALLLGAHLLITVVYDASAVYLRVVSMLVPLPFGFLLTAHAARRLGVPLLAALIVSLLAVLGMSAVTALVDNVPMFPVSLREWREVLEYAASVGLSYTTGVVLGGMSRRRGQQMREQVAVNVALARLVTNGAEGTQRFHKVVMKFNDIGGALTAAGTTAASIYMGLQGLVK